MKTFLTGLLGLVIFVARQESFAEKAAASSHSVVTNRAASAHSQEVGIHPAGSSPAARPAKYVSEVVPVKYERVQAIADALNSLGTDPRAWVVSRLVCKSKMTVLSNAWEHLSQTFKEKTARGKGPQNVVNLGQDKIIADERSNALLLYGSEKDVAILKQAIAQLDVVRSQILIEAVLLEVSLDDPGSPRPRKSRAAVKSAQPLIINESNVVSSVAFAPLATTNSSNVSAGKSIASMTSKATLTLS